MTANFGRLIRCADKTTAWLPGDLVCPSRVFPLLWPAFGLLLTAHSAMCGLGSKSLLGVCEVKCRVCKVPGKSLPPYFLL